MKKFFAKKRKGFSLVELVVVILIIAILAVAVFAGGSAAIKKAQVSRTTSDLHNFSVAIESAMNETPSVANMKNAGSGTKATYADFKAIVDAVNKNLSADYKLSTTPETAIADKNLNLKDSNNSDIVLKSAKTDAWGNPYYVIFDCGERHCKGQSDFFITVVSAGPNAQTEVAGHIESDDIFLLVQYSDGDVSAVTYNVADKNLQVTNVASADATTYTLKTMDGTNEKVTIKGVTGSMLYAGGADNATYTNHLLPVNF